MKKDFKKEPKDDIRGILRLNYIKAHPVSHHNVNYKYQYAEDEDYFFEVEDY